MVSKEKFLQKGTPAASPSRKPTWRLHDFRHHAATAFLAEGLAVNDVMEIMGRSSLQVKTRYVTPSKEAAARAVPASLPRKEDVRQ